MDFQVPRADLGPLSEEEEHVVGAKAASRERNKNVGGNHSGQALKARAGSSLQEDFHHHSTNT